MLEAVVFLAALSYTQSTDRAMHREDGMSKLHLAFAFAQARHDLGRFFGLL